MDAPQWIAQDWLAGYRERLADVGGRMAASTAALEGSTQDLRAPLWIEPADRAPAGRALRDSVPDDGASRPPAGLPAPVLQPDPDALRMLRTRLGAPDEPEAPR